MPVREFPYNPTVIWGSQELSLDPPECEGVAVDYSGNNSDADYYGVDQENGFLATGLVAGDDAFRMGPDDYSSEYGGVATAAVHDLTGSFALELWQTFPPTWDGPPSARASTTDVNGFVSVSYEDGFGWVVIYHNARYESSGTSPDPQGTSRHHVVLSVTPTTPLLYVDGSNVSLTLISQSTIVTPTGSWRVSFGYEPITGNTDGVGILDEVAIYEHSLSGARVSAHYAERDDFAAYTTEVLADTPSACYHLNEIC